MCVWGGDHLSSHLFHICHREGVLTAEVGLDMDETSQCSVLPQIRGRGTLRGEGGEVSRK